MATVGRELLGQELFRTVDGLPGLERLRKRFKHRGIILASAFFGRELRPRRWSVRV